MNELEVTRAAIQNVSKSGTKAEIIILVFSELDNEGKIKQCINFRYVQDMISKTAYYDGIKRLKEKGIVPKNELNVSENDTSVSKSELDTNVSKNELNKNVSKSELINTQSETTKKFQNETRKQEMPDFNVFLSDEPTVSKSDTIEEAHNETELTSALKGLLYTF